MKARTLHGDSIQEIDTQIGEILQDGHRATVAIVFCSVAHDLQKIIDVFNHYQIDLYGSTTAGEIKDDELFESSIVVMLLDLNREYYRLNYVDTNDENILEKSKELGLYAKSCFMNPAMIVCMCGATADAQQAVTGIKMVVEKDVPILGGLAADDLAIETTYVFTNDKILEQGVLGLILNEDKVRVNGLATSGWETIGAINTITQSDGNVVYKINDQPALDVFIKYFGFYRDIGDYKKGASSVSAQYPLQIIREDGTTVLRSPLTGNDEERSLILAGGVKDGDKFKFSIAPGFEVIDKTIEDFETFQVEKKIEQADALLLFSCAGRHLTFGPLMEDEIKGIYDCWQVPMLGFLTYGEIGSTKHGKTDLHNETCSLVVLKEVA